MADWNNKRVLVTGAGGFIGSHLAERLVEEGAQVRALVHYNALGRWGWLDRSPHLKEISVIAGDLTDRDRVQEAVRDREIVFHLGARNRHPIFLSGTDLLCTHKYRRDSECPPSQQGRGRGAA